MADLFEALAAHTSVPLDAVLRYKAARTVAHYMHDADDVQTREVLSMLGLDQPSDPYRVTLPDGLGRAGVRPGTSIGRQEWAT